LGFFNHFSPPLLGVIPESQNEYNDELFEGNKNKNRSLSFSEEQVRELIINSVKNNNIQQFRELMEQYDNFDINKKGNTGWNALHHACFCGYSDITLEIITKYKANVNIPNIESWTPLHLGSFKGHPEVVRILLSNPDTDVNSNVPIIGTPLHCACKKNNLQVVSILLFRADFKYFKI
jgi:ankyrin repeat protein